MEMEGPPDGLLLMLALKSDFQLNHFYTLCVMMKFYKSFVFAYWFPFCHHYA